MASALAGIKVVDFGQYLPGPLAAMMLADNGADVTRIDPPGGPRWNHSSNAILQRSKRSIVLDLTDEADIEIARRLVESADVLIENFRPGVMDRLGLGPEAMTKANPRLVYCSIPGFASDDERAGLPGWEGVVAAAAGLYSSRTFQAGDAPVYSAVPLASSYAAMIASHAVVAALISRERSGLGQHIEVPIFDAAMQVMGADTQAFGDGAPARRAPNRINWAVINRQLCSDGRYVDISPPMRRWANFAEKFLPHEVVESGLAATSNANPEDHARLRPILAEVFGKRPAAEWEAVGQSESHIGIAVCQTTQEWLHDQHALDSECVIPIQDDELGQTMQAGYPIHMSKTPPSVQGPRRALDADREEVLQDISKGGSNNASPNGATSNALPLDGMLVIDLCQVLAGPTAGRILAEYGADVIKINNPQTESPPTPGVMSQHTFVNNGKLTALIDLKTEDGKEILDRLIARADVLHQNFALGVPERMGIGEADVRMRRPDIIYSAINCHALGGLREDYRGHEELGQAVTGMQVRYGDEVPERAGRAVCDYSTGHMAAFAILLALYHRERTGEGQFTQAALSRSATFLQIPFMLDFEGQTWDEPHGQQTKGWGPLYRMYAAADRWIFLAAPKAGGLQSLAGVEGLSGVEQVGAGALEGELERRFASLPAEEWIKRLTAQNVSCHIVETLDEALAAPDSKRRLMVLRSHTGIGQLSSVRAAANFSRTPLDSLSGAPVAGYNGREVVERAGLGERADDLVTAGVIVMPNVEAAATS